MKPERVPAWRRYLRFWRANPDADVADELRFHLDSAVAEFVAGGMTLDAARAEAVRRFGDIDAITTTLHSLSHERERTMEWQDRLRVVRDDLRFASRQLRKNVGFTVVAVLTLALGIGANSAIFSIVYSVLLRPLPYAHADRLLTLRERNGANDTDGMVVTYGNFHEWSQRVHAFEALGAYAYGSLTLTGAGDPRVIDVLHASAGYWRALFIPPVLGRFFGPSDDSPSAPHVVVLSHKLWQSAFNGDSTIVGRSITLSGEPYTVLGVASPDYSTPTVSAYVPLALTSAQIQEHADHELAVVGLVRAGVPRATALAELTRVETQLAHQYPNSYFDGGIIARPLLDSIVGPVRTLLFILLSAVALVLLIACVNIANLLLARAGVRQKEMAVRTALGAGRGRIIAQLLTESLLLAGAGAGLGLLVAAALLRFLIVRSPLGIPRIDDATINGPVLAFTTLLAVACGVGFGLLPALRASKLDLQRTLREGGRSDTAVARGYLRATLVVCQVSMAMVLLVGAGLLVRSAVLMQRVDPGFDPHNLLVAGVELPAARYPTDSANARQLDEILGSVRAVPGVASASLVSRIPIASWGSDCNFRTEGTPPHGASFNANARVATPGYFETLRIPLLRGRAFTSADIGGGVRVAVINQRLEKKLFGGGEGIGRRISCGEAASWLTVVGISGDLHARGLGEEVRDEVYVPLSQSPRGDMAVVVRGAVPVTTLAPAIRRAVAALDPLLPLSGMRTMDEIIGRTLAAPRFISQLLSLLGALGLTLAVIGIYGVIAYVVAQRTNEIGIRIALGADTSRVLAMVVRQGVALAVLGIAIGSLASYFLATTLTSMLYGISPRDPLTFAAVALLLGAVAALASLIPARRAAKVDPLEALRAT